MREHNVHCGSFLGSSIRINIIILLGRDDEVWSLEFLIRMRRELSDSRYTHLSDTIQCSWNYTQRPGITLLYNFVLIIILMGRIYKVHPKTYHHHNYTSTALLWNQANLWFEINIPSDCLVPITMDFVITMPLGSFTH